MFLSVVRECSGIVKPPTSYRCVLHRDDFRYCLRQSRESDATGPAARQSEYPHSSKFLRHAAPIWERSVAGSSGYSFFR